MERKQRWLWTIGAGVLTLIIGAGLTAVQVQAANRFGGRPGWSAPAPGGGPGAPGGPGFRGGPGMGPGFRGRPGMGPGFGGGPGFRGGPGMGPGFRGGPGGGDQVPQAPALPGAERVTASVSIKDGKLVPDTLNVAPNKRLALTITNNDSVTHGFAIPGLGLRLSNLAPGSSRTVELNTDRPGTYPYVTDGRGAVHGTLTIPAPT